MAKQIDFYQSQPIQHFHQTNTVHTCGCWFWNNESVWQLKKFSTLPEYAKNPKPYNAFLSNTEVMGASCFLGFSDLSCERILSKILQGVQLPLSTLMLSCCFSVLSFAAAPLAPPFPLRHPVLFPAVMTFPCSVMCFTCLPGKETEAIMQFPLSKMFLIVLPDPKPTWCWLK